MPKKSPSQKPRAISLMLCDQVVFEQDDRAVLFREGARSVEVLDQPEMCLGYDDPLLAVRPRERLGEPPHVGAPSRVYGHYQRYVAGRWIRAFGDGGV